MARARRQPPLFEVLHEPSRRAGSSGSALSPGTGLRPVQVAPSGRRREPEPEPVQEPPPSTPEASEPEAVHAPAADPRWENDRSLRISQTGVLMAIAAVMVVVALTWAIAFRQGGKNEAAKLGLGTSDPAPVVNDPILSGREDPAPGQASPATRQPPAGRTQSTAAPTQSPQVITAWQPGTDPRRPAHNYLVVATLNFRDAEAMAQFLTENGIPAAAAPASEKADPRTAMANNDLHVVIPLHGVPSDEFRARSAEREALKAKVLGLGKVWKANGGSQDFSGAYWARYK